MASQLPQTMKALAIKQYTKPENYEVLQVPVPALRGPQDVLVKVHSASINPVDVKFASGLAKLMISARYMSSPLRLQRDIF
jgi:NADPH:quinone reductase-like Zn-dependent oxidoreductase